MFRMHRALIASCLATLPGAALAHSGHDAGTFVAGMSHPVSGADHVLAMVAVGLWAAQAGGRATRALGAVTAAAGVALVAGG
ncbi:MAG: HupE/UreJ family protein [Pseudomonadota bacterium]